MHAALRFAAGFYFDQLKAEAGARGLAYLQQRGFSKETVKQFGIGVAPAGWDALVTAATDAGFKPDVLEAVGLAKSREGGRGGHYDVFRDRLMFPILSPIGKVLGFGGRIHIFDWQATFFRRFRVVGMEIHAAADRETECDDPGEEDPAEGGIGGVLHA